MLEQWCSWVDLADQWFVAYASLHTTISPIPSYFCIGHAVELYLKAIIVKNEGEEKAINFDHNIIKLWDYCKLDTDFMPKINLRKSILNQDVLAFTPSPNTLSKDDIDHFFNNRELYIIANHQKDLKYFSLPMKSHKKSGAFLIGEYPNLYWIEFLKNIRVYLGYPPSRQRDYIKTFLNLTWNELPARTRFYLCKIFEKYPS